VGKARSSRRRRIALVIRLVVLGALLFAGFRFYLWHTARQEVDGVIARMAPLVNVGYANIQVGFDGRVTLKGLRIGSLLFKDTISADSLTIDTGDVWHVLGEFRGVGDDRAIPPAFSIRLNRAKIDLNSDYMLTLDESHVDLVSAPWEHAGCGDVDHFGAANLRALGYNSLTVNVLLDYRFSRFNRTATLSGNVDIVDLSKNKFEETFALEVPSIAIRDLAGLQPTLQSLTWEYADDSFIERRNDWCASRLGVSVDEFVNRHIEAVSAMAEQQGLRLGEKVLRAYRHYLTHPKALRVTANPGQPVDLSKISHYSGSALMDWLNLRVSINDEAIDPAQFHAAAPATPEGGEGAGADGETRRPPALIVWTRGGSLDALLPHVGKDVLVLTKDGRTLAGTLLSVDEAGLKVQRHVHGGTATLPVRRQAVEAARVLRGDEANLDWNQD